MGRKHRTNIKNEREKIKTQYEIDMRSRLKCSSIEGSRKRRWGGAGYIERQCNKGAVLFLSTKKNPGLTVSLLEEEGFHIIIYSCSALSQKFCTLPFVLFAVLCLFGDQDDPKAFDNPYKVTKVFELYEKVCWNFCYIHFEYF